MKMVLLGVVFALGLVSVGCSSETPKSAPDGGQSAPKDSGAGAKKGPRVPAPQK